jgi:hypothetical protein
MRSFLKRLDMIKLKTEVNKSQIMRELRAEAEDMYDAAYEGEYAIEQFLLGAESLFKKLRIVHVSGQLPPNAITDKEHKYLMKVLYPKDNSKKFRR